MTGALYDGPARCRLADAHGLYRASEQIIGAHVGKRTEQVSTIPYDCRFVIVPTRLCLALKTMPCSSLGIPLRTNFPMKYEEQGNLGIYKVNLPFLYDLRVEAQSWQRPCHSCRKPMNRGS